MAGWRAGQRAGWRVYLRAGWRVGRRAAGKAASMQRVHGIQMVELKASRLEPNRSAKSTLGCQDCNESMTRVHLP
jgi:hypothetical protein